MFLVFVLDVCYLCLRVSPAEVGGKFHVPPSVGANRHVCITNRVLPAVLISKMSETFDLLRLILRMTRKEDRHLL